MDKIEGWKGRKQQKGKAAIFSFPALSLFREIDVITPFVVLFFGLD